MEDIICTGQVTDLAPVISEVEWLEDALMILERVPTHWLSEDERENGILFRKFDVNQDFNSWQVGRIFDKEKELIWKWINMDCQIIYSGLALDLPEFQLNNADLERTDPIDYFLWGENVTSKITKGQPPVFLELQIPRLLYYPVQCKKKKARPVLKIVEYRDKATGQIQHYRFQCLEVS